MEPRPVGHPPISSRQLLAYLAALAVGAAVVQGYTALATDSRITAMTGLLLALLAAYVAVFVGRNATGLRTRAYAMYLVHAAAYLVIVGSFWIHAGLLVGTDNADVLARGWSGPLTAMSLVWGAGLLLHTIGAMLDRGYDHVEV